MCDAEEKGMFVVEFYCDLVRNHIVLLIYRRNKGRDNEFKDISPENRMSFDHKVVYDVSK